MKKAFLVLATVLLLGSTAALAAAYPTDVQYRTENGRTLQVFRRGLADLSGSGERLTPNLAGVSTAQTLPPAASDVSTETDMSAGYTAVIGELYDSCGSLGTLSAPAIGLSVKVYEGTDAAALRKGTGHFVSTSIWDAKVAFADTIVVSIRISAGYTRCKAATPLR